MNQTFENFNIKLKELKPAVREKAIQIANKLLADGKLNETDAVKEGIKQAEEWFLEMEG